MIYGAYNCYQQAIKPLNLYYKALGHISALPFPPLNKTRMGRHDALVSVKPQPASVGLPHQACCAIAPIDDHLALRRKL